MHDGIPEALVQEVYAINKLDHVDNLDFPLSMEKIQEEHSVKKLQGLIQSKAIDIIVTTIGNMEVYTIKGKVWIPPCLQTQIIDWYYTNLCHPEVTCTMNSIPQTFKWKGLLAQVEKQINHKIM